MATTATRRIMVISWKEIRTAAIADKQYADLLHQVQSPSADWPPTIQEYKRHQADLSTVDGLVLFKGRVVIPEVLRPEALQALHAAHQGESGMVLRTHQSMWWPNLTADIASIRAACTTCRANAPTQQPLPPYPPPVPQYPFQYVSTDYFPLQWPELPSTSR